MQLSSKNALSVILNLEIFFYVVSIIFQKKYQNTLQCKNLSYKKFGKMLENWNQKRWEVHNVSLSSWNYDKSWRKIQ